MHSRYCANCAKKMCQMWNLNLHNMAAIQLVPYSGPSVQVISSPTLEMDLLTNFGFSVLGT